jgi:pilus assembly protein CpaB
MNRQSLIALGVAVVLGLVAVYLANTFLVASERQQQAAGTSRVAVAAVPLNYGVEITRDKIRFADFPNASIPPGSFTDLRTLLPQGKKRVALMTMAVNEPILSSKVTGAGENASIAALLPDGMRAATVRINDVSGVAGFIQPNDSVDVLITRQATSGDNQQVTDVLQQNVRVIAIGQKAQNPDGSPVVARTATLQVDPLAAQKLALAQEIGSLSLVLRKPGEEQNSPFVETVSLGDLRSGVYGSARAYQRPIVTQTSPARVQPNRTQRPTINRKPSPVRQVAPARPRTNNVEVVRGTTGNNYEVGEYGS